MTTSAPHAAVGHDAGVARAFAIGAAVGFVAVFFLMLAIGLFTGASFGAALALSAFTAFWGGPGFGGMMGAVQYYIRHEGEM